MGNIGNAEHALTFADLRVHYYTGRSYLISGEGRDKVFGYRHGVMTDIGDLPEAEWTRLAKQLIRQSGEQELYQQLFAWEREQSHWEQSPSQFELDVLVCIWRGCRTIWRGAILSHSTGNIALKCFAKQRFFGSSVPAAENATK